MIKRYYYILIAISVLALAGAYITEIAFGWLPCPLCVYQRLIYFTDTAVILFALIFRNEGARDFLFLIILAIVNCLGAYIAFFHSGVERHWFRYDSSCTGFVDNELSLEQMIKRIESITTVACDVLGPQIFGFTMANWNALLLAFISCVTISLIFRKVVYKLP